MFDWNKRFQTKGGHSARLLSGDLAGTWSRVVAVQRPDREAEEVFQYTNEGRSRGIPELDLVNVQSFDIRLPVKTRGGKAVTIFSTCARNRFPVIGLIHYDNHDVVRVWSIDGQAPERAGDARGLVNVTPGASATADASPAAADLPIGVTRRRGRFSARIKINGTDIGLGTFDRLEDAIAARHIADKVRQ